MKRVVFIIGAIAGMNAAQLPAHGGTYSDALASCLVNNVSEADKAIAMRWAYSALSQHPSLNSMSSITNDVRTSIDANMVQLVEKYVYGVCLNQVKNAVKNEGPAAIEQSLRSYGQVAARELLQDPNVANSVSGLAQHMDFKKLFEALMKN
jgi:hypothetical protein